MKINWTSQYFEHIILNSIWSMCFSASFWGDRKKRPDLLFEGTSKTAGYKAPDLTCFLHAVQRVPISGHLCRPTLTTWFWSFRCLNVFDFFFFTRNLLHFVCLKICFSIDRSFINLTSRHCCLNYNNFIIKNHEMAVAETTNILLVLKIIKSWNF